MVEFISTLIKVHNQLLQHGFQAAWFGGLRIATTSSAAGQPHELQLLSRRGVVISAGTVEVPL